MPACRHCQSMSGKYLETVRCCTATGHPHCSEMHAKKKKKRGEKGGGEGEEGGPGKRREGGRKEKEGRKTQNIQGALHWVDTLQLGAMRKHPVTPRLGNTLKVPSAGQKPSHYYKGTCSWPQGAGMRCYGLAGEATWCGGQNWSQMALGLDAV